ncbi:MAG: 16S rRNA (cytidine(1402)-2'-O)-methyltransferase [Calditrichaeota bacterium]|nr:MAG: 16S rRNA (cytidine(1402)-2'-O)-methyltransferase [Calditrichota bacterium]
MGTLFVISTPIGNLKDITYRAVETLQLVDTLAAEDTRHSGRLLKHYNIKTNLRSFHEFNKEKQLPFLLHELKSGKNVGIITDAGTPGISDPGFSLIRAAIESEISIVPIPGLTAFVPALVVSGLPVHRFVFEGFPPVKKGRKAFFEKLAQEERTIILYESPHRLNKTVKEIGEYWGKRQLVIARELTKIFEEFLRGSVDEVLSEITEKPRKGEIVIVIEGRKPEPRKRKERNEI